MGVSIKWGYQKWMVHSGKSINQWMMTGVPLWLRKPPNMPSFSSYAKLPPSGSMACPHCSPIRAEIACSWSRQIHRDPPPCHNNDKNNNHHQHQHYSPSHHHHHHHHHFSSSSSQLEMDMTLTSSSPRASAPESEVAVPTTVAPAWLSPLKDG